MSSSAGNNGLFDQSGLSHWSDQPTPTPNSALSHSFESRNVVFSNQQDGLEARGRSINRSGLPTRSSSRRFLHNCIDSPPPPSPFDLYKDDACRSFEAALEANNRYLRIEAAKRRAIQQSDEGVTKRSKLANVCAQFIVKRFPKHRRGGEDSVSLYRNILYALKEILCDGEVTYGALILLERVYQRKQGWYLPSSSQFELFLAAYILSHKFLEDEYYNTECWIDFSNNLFSGQEIRKMQMEMVNFLNWKVAFSGEQLAYCKTRISEEFGHGL